MVASGRTPSPRPSPQYWAQSWVRGLADTNDLHTAALQRRLAAGGPLRWGSALQGSQGAEVSDAHLSQPSHIMPTGRSLR